MNASKAFARAAKKRQKAPAGPGGRHARPVSASRHWSVGLGEILLVVLLSAFLWMAIGAWMRVPGHISSLRPYSYEAVFLLSLVASATVFVPTVPLQVAIVALGQSLDPVGMGLAAGIGSGIGELTGYGLGQGGHEMLKTAPKWTRRLLDFQKKLVKSHAGLAIFALAAVPNPLFDVAGIAAGLAGLSMWEFLAYTIAGRIVRYTLLAYLGIWTHSWF